MKMIIEHLGPLLMGAFLALGLSVGGYFIGQTMYNAKVAVNTAEAKGLAERRVKADKAQWTISFRLAGKDNSMIRYLYEESEANQKRIMKILEESGFESDEIQLGLIDHTYTEFRDENQNLVDHQHVLSGSISIETEKVELVPKARLNVNKLVAEGMSLSNNKPHYYFTKLNEIKPEMLREAAQNARIAADEFAQNAGIKVGSIRSARQGGFNIRDAGMPHGDTTKIEKDVRVVTTIVFYLTD